MKKYSKLGRLLAITGLLLGGSSAAHAAQQFWVSLGSYSKLPGAEDRRNQASITFSNLSVVPSESAVGFVYRVVEGPVTSRAAAESKLEQARNAGFVDAWLLVKDTSFVMPDGLSDSELAASPSSAADLRSDDDSYAGSYGLERSASGAILDGYTSEYVGQSATYSAAESADYVNLPLGKQELVETAPAGYGLHQLRRASGAAATMVAPESRLRALDAASKKRADEQN